MKLLMIFQMRFGILLMLSLIMMKIEIKAVLIVMILLILLLFSLFLILNLIKVGMNINNLILKVMKYSKEKKINALMSFLMGINELIGSISKIDILMDIFTTDEVFKLMSKLRGVNENILSAIDRLNKNEIVEK